MFLVYGITSNDSPIELSDAKRITGLSKEELESLDYIEIIDEDTTYEEAIDEYYMNTFKEVKQI